MARTDQGVALSAMKSVATIEASTAAGTAMVTGLAVIVAKVAETVTATGTERDLIALRPQAMSIWWMS